MKRSYFIFYGSGVAYCISMLIALQIGSFSFGSITVQKPVTILRYHDLAKDVNHTERSEKDMNFSSDIESYTPAVNTISLKINTAKGNKRSIIKFKNRDCHETSDLYIYPDLVGHFPNKIHSFITSDKLNTSYKHLELCDEVGIGIYQKSNKHPVLDSKSLGGFSCIIEFPDKLS
ncbi:hypothetical protein [Chryseobacterium sp. 52]|uniref:hypothetical protein n=1 Tax=Chryseobacterium sp. 52 TaxID=2035213 RepID=UPI0011815571|nr:hypothetical protein [Chryseobacterium sp. 52]